MLSGREGLDGQLTLTHTRKEFMHLQTLSTGYTFSIVMGEAETRRLEELLLSRSPSGFLFPPCHVSQSRAIPFFHHLHTCVTPSNSANGKTGEAPFTHTLSRPLLFRLSEYKNAFFLRTECGLFLTLRQRDFFVEVLRGSTILCFREAATDKNTREPHPVPRRLSLSSLCTQQKMKI